MVNINWHKLEAGYLINQLVAYLSRLRSDIITASLHSFFLSPTFFVLIICVLCLLLFLRWLFIFIKSLKEESVLLSLTPPALTEKTSYTTTQLFSIVHELGKNKSLTDKLLGKKTVFSFEIVSSLNQGIRYLIRTAPEEVNNLKRSILAYLPQVSVKKVDEYLPGKASHVEKTQQTVLEFKLTKRFAYPLQKQDILEEHDPIAYITGMMTKLSSSELISFQIVLAPTYTNETDIISRKILNNEDILAYLDRIDPPSFLKPLAFCIFVIAKLVHAVLGEFVWAISELRNGSSKPAYYYQTAPKQSFSSKPIRIYNTFEQQTVKSIQDKIKEPLFEVSIRLLLLVKDKQGLKERINGFISSLAIFSVPKYQSLKTKYNYFPYLLDKLCFLNFRKKRLSLFLNKCPLLLSISEISDLYHFPYKRVTQTENIVKVYSKELPAPLSVKNNPAFDVVFGKNTFGNADTDIGLTDEDRSRHVYIIGQTGSGKSTIMFHMAKDDINKGRGVAVIDPHGDLAEDLLTTVPDGRINDCIYFNPFDLRYPVGINLLEITPGLLEDELEQEKELVCEGAISVFRRIFAKDENVDAHRIEYILRNSIYTAFTVKDATIFTVYDLLNNPDFQKKVISNLEDENLKNFWKNEFGRAGNYQIVKMVSGVTARIGRILFSPTAKRILEQPKSTINFDNILNSGKILICNLAEGKLGEDTSQLLGTIVIAKIQQAVMRRVRVNRNDRTPFYMFIDEFQNFATTSFTKLLSGGRKFGLRLTIAEQSTAQQEDRNVVNVILANTGTIICFRTASPLDEELMLNQFKPNIEAGDIINLPRFKFYMKLSAVEPEEPFSGETLPIKLEKDPEKVEQLIEASRNNYAIKYQRLKVELKPNRVKTGIKKEEVYEDIGSLV